MTDSDEYIIKCWSCTCEYDAYEASFCNHIDPMLICPYCLACACGAPREYIDDFLKNSPKKILEEKLILESKTSLKLGELLIRAGKITRQHLLAAIEKQKVFNKRIGQIFIMMNLLTSEELSLYLQEQKGIERMDLTDFEIDHDLVGTIGRQFCVAARIVPFEYYQFQKTKVLRFIIYIPEDLPKLKACERFKNFTLIPYEAPKEDLDRILKEIENYDLLVLE